MIRITCKPSCMYMYSTMIELQYRVSIILQYYLLTYRTRNTVYALLEQSGGVVSYSEDDGFEPLPRQYICGMCCRLNIQSSIGDAFPH